jgi:hypothetical protein
LYHHVPLKRLPLTTFNSALTPLQPPLQFLSTVTVISSPILDQKRKKVNLSVPLPPACDPPSNVPDYWLTTFAPSSSSL